MRPWILTVDDKVFAQDLSQMRCAVSSPGVKQCALCEGSEDVAGVVTPLVRGGAQVVLQGDQVVELSVLLGVHEKGEVEEGR